MSRLSNAWVIGCLCLAVGAPLGCGGDSESSASNECSCPDGQICVNGTCVDENDAGTGGTGGSGETGGSGGSSGTGGSPFDAGGCPEDQQCGEECCGDDQFCALGQQCAVAQDPCVTSDDCWFDSYCENGECIPFELPPEHDRDETCALTIDIDAIVPQVQCRWEGPPDGDAYPNHYHVMSTPVVVDFDFDGDPATLAPSIVFTTFPTAGSYGGPGVLRIIDGKTCTQQHSLDDAADATMSPASVAVGDIDGDGRAEVVAAAHGGGLLAFDYDPGTGAFSRLWRSGTCDGSGNVAPDATGGSDQWSGPSIHDLDDDGSPEVVYGGVVYGADGCIRSATLGFPGYHKGVVPVIADADEDGAMEIVFGNAIYEWSVSSGDWVAETYFSASGLSAGQVAIAELGDFPLAAFQGQDRAEVVVVSSGYARVQTLDGAVVFPATAIPGGGTGGPPPSPTSTVTAGGNSRPPGEATTSCSTSTASQAETLPAATIRA